MMTDAGVAVVGAGPVGLVTALGLARAGVPVTVYEARSEISAGQHDMIYQWSTLPGLQRLGVLDDLELAGLRGRLWSILVPTTGECLTIDLDGLRDHVEHPYNLHIPADRLAAVLLAHLDRFAHAAVNWNSKVTDLAADPTGVTMTVENPDGTHAVRAAWVVGTDGAHSVVRRSLGLGFPGTTWPHRLVAMTTRFDWGSVDFTDSTYRVDEVNPAFAGRVDRALWRFVYAESRTLPFESVVERMPAVFAAVLPDHHDPEILGWSTYRVHERAADRFRVGRVLLAGDAAHITNPVSVLGLASGLFDAYALAEALATVCEGRRDSRVLDEYARERRRVFLDTASPLSTRAMHLVLGTGGPHGLQDALAAYRLAAAEPAHLLDMYSGLGSLETPSLG